MPPDILEKKPLWRRVWFALTVCLVLLALALIPDVMQLLRYVDEHGAYAFNRVAGISPVFDRFVLLIADEDGRERIITLAAVWFLVAVWIAPTRVDKSRLLGTFFYIALVLGLYFLVDSLLDDVIERKSPSMEFLRPFNNIGKILDNKVDVTDRRTFPNMIAMILFTMGFMLLRLKRRLGGAIALALGATAPLLLCVAGLTWLTDIYLGALPLAFLVSAVAVETPFKAAHGTLVELSAAGLDESLRLGRGIVPMWKHRRLYWLSQNVFHVEVAIKRFVARELPSLLDPHQTLGEQPVQLEIPLGGLRSVVRIASLGDKKAVVRAYPLNRRHEAMQHYNASTILQKQRVRVPAILQFVDNPRRYGALFIVEEFIDGRSKKASELSDADLASMAAELVRLHSATAEVWGPLESPRAEDFGNVIMRRIEKQLGKISRGPVVAGQQSHIAQVRNWFLTWRDDLEKISEFCLVHGKLHRENCLFETDGRLCLIDTTTLQWSIGAEDLVLVHYSQCSGQAHLIEKLDKHYFDQLAPERAEQCRRLMPLYEALFCLAQVQKSNKRLKRTHKQAPADAMAKGAHWWHHLLKVITENSR
jgi:aminoglycoside phosphotransferase (APT) family kinase protein